MNFNFCVQTTAGFLGCSHSIVVSRKFDCDVCWRCQFKMALKLKLALSLCVGHRLAYSPACIILFRDWQKQKRSRLISVKKNQLALIARRVGVFLWSNFLESRGRSTVMPVSADLKRILQSKVLLPRTPCWCTSLRFRGMGFRFRFWDFCSFLYLGFALLYTSVALFSVGLLLGEHECITEA